MGLRGPQPTPTAELEKRGSWRAKKRKKDGEPQPGGVPEPPYKLVGDSRKLWESLVPRLAESGIATEVDSETLAVMCVWFGKFRKIQKALDKMAATNKDHYRLLIQMQMASNCFDKLAARFGMTPADRTRIKVEGPKEDDGADEMEDILGLKVVG